MAEHTKLPWRVFTNPDGTKLIGIGAESGEGILDAGFGVWSWNDPEGIANAHFAVKAVNNHEALVKALNEIAWMDEHLSTETAREMMSIARTALEHMHGRVGGAGS